MGGKAAIHFAINWPEMLNGLAIMDISPFTNDVSLLLARKKHEHILRSILDTDISNARTRDEVEVIISARIPSELERTVVMKNLRRDDNKSFSWKLNAQVLLRNLDLILEGIDRDKVENISVSGFPVIFLKGERSEYLNTDDYDDIARLLPAVEFRTIKKASHWIQTDNPEAVSEALISLLY
jgi:pimeloyl-ACP methyl ester carboxylesterase